VDGLIGAQEQGPEVRASVHPRTVGPWSGCGCCSGNEGAPQTRRL